MTDKWGTFIFEDLGGGLNTISENSLLLWGQNLVGYGLKENCPGRNNCKAKALEIYATTSVPEPAAMTLLCVAVVTMGWSLRRRRLIKTSL